MRKMLLTAFVAAMAFAAQAVVQNWSMNTFDYAKDANFTTAVKRNQGRYNTFNMKLSDTQGMSVKGQAPAGKYHVSLNRVTFGLSNAWSDTTMLNPAKLLLVADGKVVAESISGKRGSDRRQYIKSGAGQYFTRPTWEYEFSKAIDLDTSKTYQLVFAQSYDASTGTYVLLPTDNNTWTGGQRIAVTNQTNGTMVVDGSWTPYVDLAGTYDTVPEPTALALLALGIAGLALKRKVV